MSDVKFYASLTGPLLGLYYPIPKELETNEQRYAAMNSSRLAVFASPAEFVAYHSNRVISEDRR